MQNRATLVGVVASLLLVAGCLEAAPAGPAGAQPSSGGPSVDPDLPTGALVGKVVNDEQLPIVGANIVLVGLNSTAKTGEDGSFRFGTVNAGDYFLVATASGYKEKQRGVTVVPEETTQVTLILDSVPVPVTRAALTRYVQALNCQAKVFSPAGAMNANSKNTCLGTAVGDYRNNASGSLAADIGLVGLLIEAQWQPSQTTSRNLELELSLPYGKEQKAEGAVWTTSGSSPLSITVTKAQLEAYLAGSPGRVNYNATGGTVYFWLDVAPSVTGNVVDASVAFDQRVNVNVHHFYVVEPKDYASQRIF